MAKLAKRHFQTTEIYFIGIKPKSKTNAQMIKKDVGKTSGKNICPFLV